MKHRGQKGDPNRQAGEGLGATFRVRLPLAKERPRELPPGAGTDLLGVDPVGTSTKPRELEGIRVSVGLAEGEHALVVAGPGLFGQLPIGLGLGSDPRTWLLEPWLGGEGALGHPELAHLAWPAKGLARRAPTVDLLCWGGHFLGTSW